MIGFDIRQSHCATLLQFFLHPAGHTHSCRFLLLFWLLQKVHIFLCFLSRRCCCFLRVLSILFLLMPFFPSLDNFLPNAHTYSLNSRCHRSRDIQVCSGCVDCFLFKHFLLRIFFGFRFCWEEQVAKKNQTNRLIVFAMFPCSWISSLFFCAIILALTRRMQSQQGSSRRAGC